MTPPSAPPMRLKKNVQSAMISSTGTSHASTSGTQRLITSPAYLTPALSSSSTSFGSSMRVVVNVVGPSAFLSCPRMVVSPTATSATWPLRTRLLNSLYGIWRPVGDSRYACASASITKAPSTHQMAVGRPGTDPFFPPDGSIGLGNRNLVFSEREAVGTRVHDDAISFAEFALQHAYRQLVQHALLDRPLQRTRAIHRIIPFLNEEFLRGVCQLDLDLAVGEPLD